MKLLFLVLACSALVACGGSGSETPPPIEPTTNWQDQDKEDQDKEPPAETDAVPSQPTAPVEPAPDEGSAE